MDAVANPKEFQRITKKAKEVLGENVPGFDFDAIMRSTIQGKNNNCIYPHLAS